MPEKGDLQEYGAKRSFEKTPEPGPERQAPREGPLLFVVQKHNARNLHYDLRLELDGVLKSWAVPKGFMTGDEKHMAVMVEDHPFDYASFEGVIPEGNYGAGEVIVWDTGTYWCDEDDEMPQATREEAENAVRAQIEGGKLSFFLRGSKLKGSWALIKMKTGQDWLMIKHKDRYLGTPESALEDGDSVVSGMSIADLERGLPAPPQRPAASLIPSGKPEKMPKQVSPMLASLADQAFDDPDWVFEPKLDGVRVIVFVEGEEIRMLSRNALDLANQFPALKENLKKQFTREMVLDGEIVAFEDGKHTFASMQKRLHVLDRVLLDQFDLTIPCALYVFDLLHFEGANLRSKPLRERRRLLEQCLLPSELVQLVSQVPEEGVMLFDSLAVNGFEGLVGKRLDSIYEAGRRSKYWLKVKHTATAEFVVAGFTAGEGARSDTFGALVTGWYEDGKFAYKGNVGSGFDDKGLTDALAKLLPLETAEMPFESKPDMLGPARWVRPELVIEAKFNEITAAGSMRAPVFLRFRDDVDPKAVGPVKPPVHVQSAASPGVGKVDESEKGMIDEVVGQLQEKDPNPTLKLGEYKLAVTNLNKVLWPANTDLGYEPFTKRDFLIYLAKVSPYMIPHLRDRPLTMIRFPEGIHGQSFFQKHWEQRRPDFVESVDLYSGSNDVDQTYLLANNLPTIIWLGQLGTLEFHVWGSRCKDDDDAQGLSLNFTGSDDNIDRSVLNYPDMIKFDLDPYVYSGKEAAGDEPELNKEGFEQGKSVAFWLKNLLDSLKLNSFVKTTGKTGLHIFVPIVRNLDYDAVKDISEAFCRMIERDHPKDVTTEWSTQKRTGKTFMDYNMNVRAKTLNSPYSPRALPNQSLSMPVTWEELPDIYPTDFNMRNVHDRLARKGDVWAKIMDGKKDLSAVV